MYKITFNLRSAVSFIDLPVFDSILAWCFMKEKYGEVKQALNLKPEEVESFNDLPLVRHEDGYFVASWMHFDKEASVEFISSWKKRWASEFDHLADFGKKVPKVRINAGKYKSYDMPVVLHQTKKVWFFFDSQDVDRVQYLIEKHLWGIGKKTSQGYGEITSFYIDAISENPFEQIIRPVPATEQDIKKLMDKKLAVRWMGWKPPYWLPAHQAYCVVTEPNM